MINPRVLWTQGFLSRYSLDFRNLFLNDVYWAVYYAENMFGTKQNVLAYIFAKYPLFGPKSPKIVLSSGFPAD